MEKRNLNMANHMLADLPIKGMIRLPAYAKITLLLIGLYIFIDMLYIAQDIIIPVLYATIISILACPLLNFMVSKHINRTISIVFISVFAILFFIALIILIVSQTSILIDALPLLFEKFEALLKEVVKWFSGYLNTSEFKINVWVANAKAEFLIHSNIAIGMTLITMGGMITTTLLTLVYMCMLLYYQPHLVKFIHKLFGVYNDNNVSEILTETRIIIENYLAGLLLEFVVLAILNSLGLLLLGIEYAILLGIVGAILNVIPYIGGIVGVAIFATIALVTKSPVYVLYVTVLYTAIQFIDNNYIGPKLIGSKVKLNAFVSMFSVIIGAGLWGIPGMFLSIPVIAILKLIFDRIDAMEPWGFLLGDTMPPLIRLK